MFTGIIETTGQVTVKTKNTLTIKPAMTLDDLKLGSSIAVDGVCLTLSKLDKDQLTADVMPITFERTTLGERNVGDEVNLERAMVYGKRFEGHMVAGHVEGRATLTKMQIQDNAYHLHFSLAPELSRYLIKTGSIALNGISLTVIDCHEEGFEVGIIPHTWENTNLQHLALGDKVNVETDLLAKYAIKLAQSDSMTKITNYE